MKMLHNLVFVAKNVDGLRFRMCVLFAIIICELFRALLKQMIVCNFSPDTACFRLFSVILCTSLAFLLCFQLANDKTELLARVERWAKQSKEQEKVLTQQANSMGMAFSDAMEKEVQEKGRMAEAHARLKEEHKKLDQTIDRQRRDKEELSRMLSKLEQEHRLAAMESAKEYRQLKVQTENLALDLSRKDEAIADLNYEKTEMFGALKLAADLSDRLHKHLNFRSEPTQGPTLWSFKESMPAPAPGKDFAF